MAFDPSEYNTVDPYTGKKSKLVRGAFGQQTWVHAPDEGVGGGLGNVDLAGGYNQANTQMQDFLKQPMPQYQGPGANRFETGLSGAEGRLSSLLDDPSSIQQTAAYKFRLGQGEQALQRQQAARGMAGSGNRLMELSKYGQDMASQEYDNQASRLQNLLGSYQGAWNQAQGTNVQEALGKYGTATQGHSARGNTLASLMGDATSGYVSARGQDISKERSQPTMRSTGGWGIRF